MALHHALYRTISPCSLHSTWFYIKLNFTLRNTTLPCVSFTLLHSITSLYHGSTWLYLTLPWLHFSLLDTIIFSTKVLLHFTCLYFTLPWLLVHNNSLLDSTSLYHGSTSLHLNPHHSTMGLLLSISLYNITFTLLVSTLLSSTSFHHARLYITLLDSTSLYHGSTCPYINPSMLYFSLHI